jgi:hypothetical protein
MSDTFWTILGSSLGENQMVTVSINENQLTITVNGTPYVYEPATGDEVSAVVDGNQLILNINGQPIVYQPTFSGGGDGDDVQVAVNGNQLTITVNGTPHVFTPSAEAEGALVSNQTEYVAALANNAVSTISIGSVVEISSGNYVHAKRLKFYPGGRLKTSGAAKITFETSDISFPSLESWIFEGFGFIWKSLLPLYTPEMFGAKADDVFDNSPIINKLIESFACETSLNGQYAVGGTIAFLPSRKYYFADTIVLTRAVHLMGFGASIYSQTAQLRFAPNKEGIRFEHGATVPLNPGDPPNTVYPFTSANSILKNISLLGAAGGHTHTVNLVGLTVTRLTGEPFNDQGGYSAGTVLTINNNPYIIESVVDGDHLTIFPHRIALHKEPNDPRTPLAGDLVGEDYRQHYDPAWVGATFNYRGVACTVTGVSADNTGYVHILHTNANLPTTVPYHDFDCEMSNFNLLNVEMRVNKFHGVNLRLQARLQGVQIRGFAGDGLFLNSVDLPSRAPATVPNCNLSICEHLNITGCKGHGIRTKGVNSNQFQISHTDCTNCEGFGIYESSFLGGSYDTTHTSYCYQGGIFCNSVGDNVFKNPYNEESQPNDKFTTGEALILGGNLNPSDIPDHAVFARVTTDSSAMALTNRVRMASIDNKRLLQLGGIDGFKAFFAFGDDSDPDSSGDGNLTYYMSKTGTNKFDLTYKNPYSGNGSLVELTNINHPIGPNQIIFPRGIVLTDANGVRYKITVSTGGALQATQL